ncbi:MAG: Asp-tRNA(Asn)/Glu-tRNA(Gln) amidotransferase subunit GatA [Acidimicrobiia bacterium]
MSTPSQELHTLSVHALSQALQAKQVSAVEAASHFLARGRAHTDLGAYVAVHEETTLQQARAADARIAKGDAPALTGVPIAHKDIFVTKDFVTTAGSRMLQHYQSPFDATVVANLAHAGAVTLGKLNCDEFAMGSSTENSAFGVTLNPRDTSRVAGGSSGGSAAAVAAGFAPVSLGSDTGGSIRQPAALCGVVGVKPTYGTVSRYGLVAFASSLDQIGPFATDVRDAALVLESISGHDPLDSTSIPSGPLDVMSVLDRGVEGMRVGRITDMPEGADPDVLERLEQAFDSLRAAGATIVDVELPSLKYGLTAYYLIAPAEASSNLARYDGVRYGMRVESPDTNSMYMATRATGFGDEVKRRIMLGTYALSAGYYDAYYGKALKVRRVISDDFARAYGVADVLLTPTSPIPAFKVGEKADDPLSMYLCDVYTIPTNLAGHPAMSVPFGDSREGLPIGVQVMASTLAEQSMFRVAASLERHMVAEGVRS